MTLDLTETPEAKLLNSIVAFKHSLDAFGVDDRFPIAEIVLNNDSYARVMGHVLSKCKVPHDRTYERNTDSIIWNNVKIVNHNPPDFFEDDTTVFDNDIAQGYSPDPSTTQYLNGFKILRTTYNPPNTDVNDANYHSEGYWHVVFARPRRRTGEITDARWEASQQPAQDANVQGAVTGRIAGSRIEPNPNPTRMPPPPRWALINDPVAVVPTPPIRENPFLHGDWGNTYREALDTLTVTQIAVEPDEVPYATDTRMQPE